MYRIMLVVSKKENSKSLYQYLTSTVENVTSPMEFEDETSLDKYVESMLNNGYAKSDFIIVKPVEYTLTADGYTPGDE